MQIPSIHPLLISPPCLFYFFADATPLSSPVYDGWSRAVFVIMVQYFLVDLSGGGGRDDKKTTHPFIFDQPPLLLYFFADTTPLSSPVSFTNYAVLH